MLEELARKHGTDKAGHGYMPHYERHFEKFKNETFNLLEIGVHKGASLRMWKEYFPNAQIHGIDKNPAAKEFEEDRIKVHIGSQGDAAFLHDTAYSAPFKIIIDDGSHMWWHQTISCDILFKGLTADGVYVVEDLHTSYHNEFKGGNEPPAIYHFTGMIHDMNTHGYCYGNRERDVPPTYFEQHISGMHFYKSICFIEKK